jgi:hypothetical protein
MLFPLFKREDSLSEEREDITFHFKGSRSMIVPDRYNPIQYN